MKNIGKYIKRNYWGKMEAYTLRLEVTFRVMKHNIFNCNFLNFLGVILDEQLAVNLLILSSATA